MATTVVMPQMGFDMQEGTIVRWLKQEGDEVSRGEPIAEIETDKAIVEMEAFASGVLLKTVVGEGQTVPVGQTIAVIGTSRGAAAGSGVSARAYNRDRGPDGSAGRRRRGCGSRGFCCRRAGEGFPAGSQAG